MSRILPAQPSLEHLKKQAKNLLRSLREKSPDALERVRAATAAPAGPDPRLADAQHVLAREYGFESWPKLRAFVESRSADPVEAFVAALKSNDLARVRELFKLHPALESRVNDPLPGLAFDSLPLHAAVGQGNRAMIDLLLKHGADINGRSHWWAGGFGLLDGADPALAPFLVERGAVIDAHAAARLGMLDRLQELVGMNPPVVHARGGDGQTPLHVAANVEIAAFLVDHGAEIEVRDIDHESTPAQYMVRDRQEVVRFLVGLGCKTDILMAAALGDIELVRRHLDADPDSVRMMVSEQYFPRQNPRSGGTIYTWTLGSYKTAHVVAREFGHEPVFQLLMSRSPDELKLALACEVGDETLFQALLAQRPDLARNLSPAERQKLVNAAQNNNLEAVRLMLAAGWPLDARGQHGGTALHWAAWLGNPPMIREILHYHPPIDARDDAYNQTPLGWAFHGSVNCWDRGRGDYAASVEALLEAGARPPETIPEMELGEPVRAVLRRFTNQADSPAG